MLDPILFVVDDDSEALGEFERALRRRYGADFRVMAEHSPEVALATLERLAQRGEEVALVIADLHLPGIDGVEFLERARALHQRAMRALLLALDRRGTRIPFSELEYL